MSERGKKFQFTVDGVLYDTGEKILEGSQIRELAGLVPASDFVLIQISGGVTRSIGLDDEVKLAGAIPEVFLSFASDRIFTFTVNERGWEWGAPAISAADIYRYGGIDEDNELILDSDADSIIPTDGELKLDGTGVERIRSREPKLVTIKVNGRERTVERRPHSYREIAAIAYPNPDFENFNYTITYLRGVGGAEGDLVEGETIAVKKGMVFNVRRSDKS